MLIKKFIVRVGIKGVNRNLHAEFKQSLPFPWLRQHQPFTDAPNSRWFGPNELGKNEDVICGWGGRATGPLSISMCLSSPPIMAKRVWGMCLSALPCRISQWLCWSWFIAGRQYILFSGRLQLGRRGTSRSPFGTSFGNLEGGGGSRLFSKPCFLKSL